MREAVLTPPLPGRRSRRWRNLLAAGVIIATVLGSTSWTDDAWPFAPFRMFSRATDPNGRVWAVAFEAETADGDVLQLDASAFHLRRAEVEGQLVEGHALPDSKLADLATVYNLEHSGGEEIVRLEMYLRGYALVDGEKQHAIHETKTTWSRE